MKKIPPKIYTLAILSINLPEPFRLILLAGTMSVHYDRHLFERDSTQNILYMCFHYTLIIAANRNHEYSGPIFRAATGSYYMLGNNKNSFGLRVLFTVFSGAVL